MVEYIASRAVCGGLIGPGERPVSYRPPGSHVTTAERISIVIPAYRATAALRACLRSLCRQADPATTQVIVVDDASSDGTAEMVEGDFPEVELVRRRTNGGFARAVNTGMDRVSPESRFIAVLNSDTAVEPGWLEPALEAMRRDPSIGAVAPRIVRHDEPAVIDSAGMGYTIAGWAYRRGHGRRFGPPFDEAAPVLGPTGTAAVFRREALRDQPSLYRGDLAGYYEDTELALRLQLAGWGCLYVPDSVVRHRVSRSYGRAPARKTYHVSCNLEMVFWEYMPGRLLWRAVWDHLLFTALHATSKILRGQGAAFLKGKIAFIRRAAEARRRRREVAGDVAAWIERGWLQRVIAHRSR
jgi:GT2 family glycosyltransferase